MLVRAWTARFSSKGLLNKIPKTVVVQQPKSWLHKIIEYRKNSLSYLLQKQLFDYLQSTKIVVNEFPLLNTKPRYLENWMILHVCVLKARINQEKLPTSELHAFDSNLQTYFFPDYAQFANPVMPVTEFKQTFSQIYMNKLVAYQQMVQNHEIEVSPNHQEIAPEKYVLLFRKLVYENIVNPQNVELMKFCRYYTAHKKYLQMLSLNDMMDYKVKWGFEELRLIGEVGSNENNTN